MERVFDRIRLEEMPEVAEILIAMGANVGTWTFKGPLGAGKTTLIKAICNKMGVTENVQSPTFSIINLYETGSETIYHFDCYRLKRLEEALDFGIEEYLDSGKRCLIEWPELIEPLLQGPVIEINIKTEDTAYRSLALKLLK